MAEDMRKKPMTLLMADDDEDDRIMIKDALKEANLNNPIEFVENGEELIGYLKQTGKYSDKKKSPRPGLILLDLHMPVKDGFEVLKEIKSDPDLHQIPIIILTTSKDEEDVAITYNLGANSFIIKPVSFKKLVEIVETIGKYWFEIVKLP